MTEPNIVQDVGVPELRSIVGGVTINIAGGDQTFARTTRGIYVGGSGDLAVEFEDGTQLTFVDVAAGIIHPIAAAKVLQSGTDATSLVAVW